MLPIVSAGLFIIAGCSSGTSNDRQPATPTISIANGSVSEGDAGNSMFDFLVTLSAAASGNVTVNYTTADGTATAPSDYDSANGTVIIAAGATSATISIVVHGDTTSETNESFTVTLSSPAGATLANGVATGTVTNDDPSNSIFGLDTRPDNQTCVAPARPNSDVSVSVTDPFPLLSFGQPTKMLLEPVASPRWFVLSKTGQVTTFDPGNPTSQSTFLDLSVPPGVIRTASEGGLLGMAFHPDYPNTPEVFLSYTINYSNPAMRSVVSRFILDNIISPGAGTVEQVILQVDQPFGNHNGGDIAFGPDGNLYIGLGDGGSGGDPNDNGQNTTTLLGSMLRIDVTGPGVSYPSNPYDIPFDNPFAGGADCGPAGNAGNCPEIYAWGLRNPWRWTFDPDTAELWLADVGQGAFEEVDVIERGGNYGWRCREGAHDFNTSGCSGSYIDPVAEYGRALGNSITGGFVYRGTAISDLIGKYVFADYGSGRIWALQPDGQGGYLLDEIADTNFGPTSFGVDDSGELYFTDINNGRLRMIGPAGGGPANTIEPLLSDTGCTDPADVTQAYNGLLPYDINAPFWSDGAIKERFIGLPNGTAITRDADGDWSFPNGTVIVKNFRLNGALIETRHLMRHPDGVWAGYTYEWNSQQTEATRVEGGKTVAIGGQDWIYPSEGQCMQCHTSVADFALGPETAQVNKDFTYPSTQITANQLETLDHILMFTSPLPGPASGLAALSDPTDGSASVEDRARAYLHTNCAQCHRPGGPTPADMDLRYDTALGATNACDVAPLIDDLGIANARLIAPGDSARSVIINRVSRRDSSGMPPTGSNEVDNDGVSLLTTWIDGLVNCN